MEKSNDFMVWTITTLVCFCLVSEFFIRIFEFRVDWNELYNADHYQIQEDIYKDLRPTLLSHTLVVPTQKIRGHIRDLTANDNARLKDQIERFYRTNKTTTDCQSSVLNPMNTLHHLQTYTIEVNQ
jgi:hypothetical protein